MVHEGEAHNPAPEAGLCARCLHVRCIRTDKGTVYFMCRAAGQDDRLSKYPRLPVLECHAFAENVC